MTKTDIVPTSMFVFRELKMKSCAYLFKSRILNSFLVFYSQIKVNSNSVLALPQQSSIIGILKRVGETRGYLEQKHVTGLPLNEYMGFRLWAPLLCTVHESKTASGSELS